MATIRIRLNMLDTGSWLVVNSMKKSVNNIIIQENNNSSTNNHNKISLQFLYSPSELILFIIKEYVGLNGFTRVTIGLEILYCPFKVNRPNLFSNNLLFLIFNLASCGLL